MDVVQQLLDAGFRSVWVLRGCDCGIAEQTLLLAIMPYQAEAQPADHDAWIHPYYFSSQRAYLAASGIVKAAQAAGIPLSLRDEVRVKPLFARMPGVNQGHNTLSYLPDAGSRFHVQILALDQPLTPTVTLQDVPHPLHCGNCTRCFSACPTCALDAHGFHREKCLRNWQFSGKTVPEALRPLMGNRLLGCDECQRCCPHNPCPRSETLPPVSLETLLNHPREAAAALRDVIGANLALPNRVLAQALLVAGCSKNRAWLPAVSQWINHPSPTVAAHAQWAFQTLAEEEQRPAKENDMQ